MNLSPGVARADSEVVRSRGDSLTTGASNLLAAWTSAVTADRLEVAKLRKNEEEGDLETIRAWIAVARRRLAELVAIGWAAV